MMATNCRIGARLYTAYEVGWCGKQHDEMVEGFTVVIFQHEIDHLNGILFTDRLQEQSKETYSLINGKIELYLQHLLKRQ